MDQPQQLLEVAIADVVPPQFFQRAVRVVQRGAVDARGAGEDRAVFLFAQLAEWGGAEDLWVFGYGSLIWRPDFVFAERRPARVHGWHRAL